MRRKRGISFEFKGWQLTRVRRSIVAERVAKPKRNGEKGRMDSFDSETTALSCIQLSIDRRCDGFTFLFQCASNCCSKFETFDSLKRCGQIETWRFLKRFEQFRIAEIKFKLAKQSRRHKSILTLHWNIRDSRNWDEINDLVSSNLASRLI